MQVCSACDTRVKDESLNAWVLTAESLGRTEMTGTIAGTQDGAWRETVAFMHACVASINTVWDLSQ